MFRDDQSLSTPMLAPPRAPWVGVRLSAMMFLEHAARGIWYPYLANYLQAAPGQGGLGFTSSQVGWIMGLATAVGAITSPLVAGQLADRYLNAERALGMLALASGLLLLLLARAISYPTFLLLSLLQSLAYMPTLSLTNGLSFTHLHDPEHSFPLIRMWGTIAWMVASTAFPLLILSTGDPTTDIARIAWGLTAGGVLCLMLTAFSFLALPRTPPKHSSAHPFAFIEAFALIGKRPFLILILIALPISIVHTAYYIRIGPFYQQVFASAGISLRWVGPALAVGQLSEVAALFFLGQLLKRLGYRQVFAVALGAFALRFSLFAVGNPPALVIAGGALHGICFAFFFAAAYVYVEKIAPPQVRHSAQTLFNLVIMGVGPILAGFYNSYFNPPTASAGQNYRLFWGVQAGISVICALPLLIFPQDGPVNC